MINKRSAKNILRESSHFDIPIEFDPIGCDPIGCVTPLVDKESVK